jgi:hypothetical protein
MHKGQSLSPQADLSKASMDGSVIIHVLSRLRAVRHPDAAKRPGFLHTLIPRDLFCQQ